jgi:deferrochelatase/peroxidase EfeB
MKKLQEGIYYRRDQFDATVVKNDTFAAVFLRFADNLTSSKAMEHLQDLWLMYRDLKRGILRDLPSQRVSSGDLKILIGFGPRIFSVQGIVRKIPRDLKERQFCMPVRGKSILEGSGIKFCEQPTNQGISEHIMIQFVSKSQLAAYRAVAETWKHVKRIEPPNMALSFTTFFTGFQRDDGRSWLGFHDEVSNMKNATERKKAIVIDIRNNNLIPQDYWTAGGTYIAFMRLRIDLAAWEAIERRKQEILIGRDKLSGVPLIGVDRNGNPIKRIGCPPHSKIRTFDKRYHDHPDYFQIPDFLSTRRSKIDANASVRLLSQSHIGRTRHMDRIKSCDPASRRIFRQGFEFIEPSYSESHGHLQFGLNFISFQNDPSRLLFILTDPNWLGNSNFGGAGNIYGLKNFLTVQAGGIFFVPPVEKPFPGASIFRR